MSENAQVRSKSTGGGRPRKSLIHDPVNPQDWNQLAIQFACEQCSLYDPENNWCTLGHNTTPHLIKNQVKSYEITGRIAICRFLEID